LDEAMSVVLLIGDHPRHFFLARAAARTGQLCAVIVEKRENHIPALPSGIAETTQRLFVHHFNARAVAEDQAFGTAGSLDDLQDIEIRKVGAEELNGPATWDIIERVRPRLLLSYGVHKLTGETLARAPGHRWNIHGGLSPWYRGTATHFWPSYLLEPQMTGMTVHETTDALDGGDIVHQTVGKLVRGDGLHALACRAVVSIADDLPELITRACQEPILPLHRQGTTGRIWRTSDWRPAHLHLIYEHYRDRIVDRYLDGEFGLSSPKLIKQF
jgi:folate-dependent phosphoribosylglycinamide formyltransferase PurN